MSKHNLRVTSWIRCAEFAEWKKKNIDELHELMKKIADTGKFAEIIDNYSTIFFFFQIVRWIFNYLMVL